MHFELNYRLTSENVNLQLTDFWLHIQPKSRSPALAYIAKY